MAQVATPPLPSEVSPPVALASKAKRRAGLRRVLAPVLLVLVVAVGAVAFNLYWQAAHYVSTDNAQVAGQPVSVGALETGRVASVAVVVGQSVRQGDVL